MYAIKTDMKMLVMDIILKRNKNISNLWRI